MYASANLRRQEYSGESSKFFTNCCVMLEPPCRASGELASSS